MADLDSSLPVKTLANGDVAVKVVDGTTTSQALAVDASGRVIAKLADTGGTGITSQASGGQRALDVGIDVAGVQVDPRSIRTLTTADAVTATQGPAAAASGAWPIKVTDGTSITAVKAASTAASATDPSVVVALSPNSPLPTGTNVIGSVNQGTSPWVTKDQSDGPVAPGTAASFSQLMGGTFNTSPPTLTSGQQAAIQVDSSGRLLSSVVLLEDQNYGTVGANTLRTASQIGNATGAADFNSGATSAQTLRVSANQGAASTASAGWFVKPTDGTNSQAYLSTGEAKVSVTQPIAAGTNNIGKVSIQDSSGAAFSLTNPLPVTFDTIVGSTIADYKDASAVAAGASDTHTYTVTSGKTLYLDQIEASSYGRAKCVVQVETSVASGVFTVRFAGFNSSSNPNVTFKLNNPIAVAAGVRVQVIMTNKEPLLAEDQYSTICGVEQ